MNSIIIRDNLGTTKNWKFLRDDLLSIVSADDDRLNKEYENGEIETVFDEMAKDYLNNWMVSGFCIDAEDNIGDVLEMIIALACANGLGYNPFGWSAKAVYKDDKLYDVCPSDKEAKGAVPAIFMIDISKAGENYNEDFQRTLDEYMTLFGYGHMDCVYEQRLVYINKVVYALSTKDTSDVKDSLNNDLYVVKFEPYKFNLLIDNTELADIVSGTVLSIEAWLSIVVGGKEEFDICSSGNEEFDDRIHRNITSLVKGPGFKFKVDCSASKTDNGYHYTLTSGSITAKTGETETEHEVSNE